MIYRTSKWKKKQVRLLNYNKQLGSFWGKNKTFDTEEQLTVATSPGDIKLGASSEREKRQSRSLHVAFVHMHRPCAMEAHKAVRQVRHRGLLWPAKTTKPERRD